MAASLSQTMSLSTRLEPAEVSKPQSVPAMTRLGSPPTASTANQSKEHVQVPEMGTRHGAAMKRLYTREDGKTYRGMGYICEAGHVELDSDQSGGNPDSHILTPTWPVSVTCLLNGEVVERLGAEGV